MFIRDGELLGAVQAAFKRDSIAPYWADEIVPAANAQAYRDIVGRLLGRGFTKAQIDAWDGGQQCQRHLGLFWALTNGGALEGFSDTYIRSLDRRRELETMLTLEINGVWTKPGDTTNSPGLITTGTFDDTNDMFVPIDTDDGRIGSPMRW